MDKLRAMQVFKEVAKQHSFSRAAENLDLANSAVSRYVNELEQWLGIKLLYRTTRSLTLTDDGKIYLEKIENIIDSVNELESTATRGQQELRGKLKITAPNFWGTFVLKPLLMNFLNIHTKVTIQTLFLYRRVNLIEEGYDLAIRIGKLPDSGLIAREVSTLSLKLVASPKYIAEHGTPRHPKDLLAHQCLIDMVPDFQNKWPFTESGKSFSVAVSGNNTSNEPELLRDLALNHQGIVYLPQFFTDPFIASGEFIELLPDFTISDLPVNLVYPQNKQMNPALRAFIDMLIEHLANT